MNNSMIMEAITFAFAFLGGFGMFIYGMNTMAEGLQKSAAGKMKQLLAKLTANRFMAITLGAVITAIIQSSSATTVMVVGFVNAGLMNLVQAIGVIMGANVGTTITSWIVSSQEWLKFLKPSQIAPLAIFIGSMLLFFGKQKHKKIGEIIVGFGLIFIGLELMSSSIDPYKDSPVFSNAFRVLGANPLLGVLVGAVVTAIIQSSSASVGILQTLAVKGLIPVNAAVFIILGQNIGTCVTAILSSIGTSKTAKRAAIMHLLFNTIGTAIFFIIVYLYFNFINVTMGSMIITSTQISIFHTIFNIAVTVVLFPFANLIVELSKKIIPGTDEAPSSVSDVALAHLDERVLETPTFAVENAIKEVVNMGIVAKDNLDLSIEALLERDAEKVERVNKQEEVIDKLQELITDYLIKINKTPISSRQRQIVTNLYSTISDIERIGDHSKNISEFANEMVQGNISFTETGIKEVKSMSKYVSETFELAIQARQKGDIKLVDKVADREEEVDKMEEYMRNEHIERLNEGRCSVNAGVIFLDIVSNLERISDHSLNIVEYVQSEVEV